MYDLLCQGRLTVFIRDARYRYRYSVTASTKNKSIVSGEYWKKWNQCIPSFYVLTSLSSACQAGFRSVLLCQKDIKTCLERIG